MTREELDAFVAQANKSADQLKDFYAGLGIALEAMLVSPNVLFVAEIDWSWIPRCPGRQRLDAFSLATRMSLFLWNAVLDDNVLKAAESGEIQTPEGRARVVDMMLSSRRLDAGVRASSTTCSASTISISLSKRSGDLSAIHRPGGAGCARTDLAHHRRSLLV